MYQGKVYLHIIKKSIFIKLYKKILFFAGLELYLFFKNRTKNRK